MENYDAMEALCHEMLSLVCGELGLAEEYVSQLKETVADGGNGVVSMSNLTMFKYGVEGKVCSSAAAVPFLHFLTLVDAVTFSCQTVDWLHLPYHTDIGLVTAIPQATGGGGLHVYDWTLNSWVDVESTVPDG